MPGPQVKNWPMYEALVREGKSKQSAARITNAKMKESTRGRGRPRSRAKHRKRSR